VRDSLRLVESVAELFRPDSRREVALLEQMVVDVPQDIEVRRRWRRLSHELGKTRQRFAGAE
jgi:hypothetical protein